MALQANNYQLPQGVALPAAYLKITEVPIRMEEQPDGTSVPVVTIYYKVFKDSAARQGGVPSFPDTPSVVLTNPAPVPSGALMDQLYAGLAQGLGIPNTLV
jgi:hypothetical protein